MYYTQKWYKPLVGSSKKYISLSVHIGKLWNNKKKNTVTKKFLRKLKLKSTLLKFFSWLVAAHSSYTNQLPHIKQLP